MGKHLAIEWDQKELRCLLARVGRGKVRVLAAQSVPLPQPSAEPEGEEDVVLLALASVVAEWKLKGVPTTMVLPRRSVELLDLTAPPTPDPELPELVQNLVAGEAAVREDDVVDFAVHDRDEEQSRRVTAVVLSAAELNRLQSLAQSVKLRLHRVLLRPYVTAGLFLKEHPARRSRALLVNVVGEEADLVLVADGLVKATRTVRLPGSPDQQTAFSQLLDEVRRTVLVAPLGETDEPTVEGVFVLGGQRATDFAAHVEAELGFEAEAFDVFATVAGETGKATYDDSYAPLLAAAHAEAARAEPLVDLLHPKKPPKPPNRKLYAAGVAAAVLAVAGYGYHYVQSQLEELDQQNQALATRVNELTQTLRKVQRKRILFNAVNAWQRGGVNWLDELRDLAQRLPPDNEVVFQSISVGPARAGLSVVTIRGVARSQRAVVELERLLRDRFHQVRTPKLEERVRNEKSYWQFETSVYLVRREPAQYRGGSAQPVVAQQSSGGGGAKTASTSTASGRSRTNQSGGQAGSRSTPAPGTGTTGANSPAGATGHRTRASTTAGPRTTLRTDTSK